MDDGRYYNNLKGILEIVWLYVAWLVKFWFIDEDDHASSLSDTPFPSKMPNFVTLGVAYLECPYRSDIIALYVVVWWCFPVLVSSNAPITQKKMVSQRIYPLKEFNQAKKKRAKKRTPLFIGQLNSFFQFSSELNWIQMNSREFNWIRENSTEFKKIQLNSSHVSQKFNN